MPGDPPAFGWSDLLVFDEAGQRIPSTGAWPYRELDIATWDLAPRSVQAACLQDPENGFAMTEWGDIKLWGYSLTRPGDYTIYAIPTIEAFERIGGRTGPWFLTSPSDRSNAVHVRITQ